MSIIGVLVLVLVLAIGSLYSFFRKHVELPTFHQLVYEVTLIKIEEACINKIAQYN